MYNLYQPDKSRVFGVDIFFSYLLYAIMVT